MARHMWEEFAPPNSRPFDADPAENRKCRNCGAIQHMTRDHSWGRVISRQWLPLVGRCKP